MNVSRMRKAIGHDAAHLQAWSTPCMPCAALHAHSMQHCMRARCNIPCMLQAAFHAHSNEAFHACPKQHSMHAPYMPKLLRLRALEVNGPVEAFQMLAERSPRSWDEFLQPGATRSDRCWRDTCWPGMRVLFVIRNIWEQAIYAVYSEPTLTVGAGPCQAGRALGRGNPEVTMASGLIEIVSRCCGVWPLSWALS